MQPRTDYSSTQSQSDSPNLTQSRSYSLEPHIYTDPFSRTEIQSGSLGPAPHPLCPPPTHSDSLEFIQVCSDSFDFSQIRTVSLRFIQIHSAFLKFIQIDTDSLRPT